MPYIKTKTDITVCLRSSLLRVVDEVRNSMAKIR